MGRESRFDMFIKSMDVLSKVIQRVKNAGLEKYGLKSIHFMILFYLEKAENGLTSKELINLTLEDKAAISRGIAALVDKGYVNYSKKYKSRITFLWIIFNTRESSSCQRRRNERRRKRNVL